MRGLLLTSLLWTAVDPTLTVAVLRVRYAYLRETRPALPDSLARRPSELASPPSSPPHQEFVRWNPEPPAVSAVRDLIVYSLPFEQCPACRRLHDQVGEGDATLRLRWVKQNWPAWVTAAPTIYDPQRHRYRVGVATLDQLREWVGLPSNATLQAATPFLAGTISDATAFHLVEDFLRSWLGPANGLRVERGGTITWGRHNLLLPSPTVLRWEAQGDELRGTFTGSKPKLRGWGLEVPLEGFRYHHGLLTLQLQGLPDWQLRIGSSPPVAP